MISTQNTSSNPIREQSIPALIVQSKNCSCGARIHEVVTAYAETELGLWMNCACGSTLLFPVGRYELAPYISSSLASDTIAYNANGGVNK